MNTHLIQVGAMGAIGRFESVDRRRYLRHDKVICRTARGLETGIVLATDNSLPEHAITDGQILRKVTPEDQMIIERIDRFRDRAYLACAALIRQRGLTETLVDVEHLFDGQNIYFYFVGPVSSELQSLTEQLGQEYEAKVRFRRFAETLANGCGPDCGTTAGCADQSCQSCSLGGCASRR